ncbi:hypothetical protein RN001_002650 [Aquatica leii]|uniref:Uncharacterized protein n=1 Tax=Aquatica leii TaxID=1421715 RepID=A0AAN7SLX6_9COLE|nr:hypothetical protein RN001_002650 [Aquatica leii]
MFHGVRHKQFEFLKKILQCLPQRLKKNQVEWINVSNKPKNDTFGNNFYQIKLDKKNTKTKNSTSVRLNNKNHLKENWYDQNIPIPTPNPEILIYSPDHSISDASASNEEDNFETVSPNPGNVLSQFELDLIKNPSSFEKIDSACPNVHLTNSVLGASSKQGCSDLNIAINTYLNHNQNRLPERLPVATNDLEAASSGASGAQILPPPGLAASAPAAGLDTLSNPVGAAVSDSGGGGPLGSLPSLPQFPKLPKLPNLTDIMSLLRLLGKSLGLLNGALSKLSPLLYIIPVISFLFGFITFLPFYPWWLPLFFLAGKGKEPPKTQFIVHKHVHKPIHHNDGWFWNHNTKTWINVHDRVRPNQPQIGDTIKQLTNQLIDVNATSSQITLDTRTPPRVKQHIKKTPIKNQQDEYENSHPGIVEPVHNIDLLWEESTKKLNFYKMENKATTSQGISTWVLLNSQTVPPSFITTIKSTPKPTTKQKFDDNKNLTRSDIFNKITKPLFKKRPLSTTTKKPSSVQVEVTTQSIDQKFTKIKASVLNNAIVKNKNSTTTTPITTLSKKVTTRVTEMPILTTTTSDNNTYLSVEPKDDQVELLTTTMSSKKRRTTISKKKKNKIRRRRPSLEKTAANNTKLATKEKPIGTQIYNYLSREIMPTVGVGIVGLMVTAGLASYFLYPFGPVRRSYDIDRKDKQGVYYYNDEYMPGGISEEEAIGKVIAGMPIKSSGSNYPIQNIKGGYQNKKTDEYGLRRGQSEASVEALYLTPSQKYNDKTQFSRRKEPDLFNNPFAQTPFNQEVKYVTNKDPFFGASEVTPVVVPEHGPRNLPEISTPDSINLEHLQVKIRKRRSNEIFKDEENNPLSNELGSSFESTTLFNQQNTTVAKKPPTLMNKLRLLLETQIKVGLEFLQKTTQAVASYFLKVNKRFNSNMDKEQSRIFLH